LTVNDGTNSTVITNLGISIVAINDVPSFEINTATHGTSKTVHHNDPLTALSLFAINPSTGPANESAQTYSYIVSTANPGAFAIQPTVNAAGTLSFRPKPGTPNGTSVLLSVRIKDNASGTSPNVNTSAAQNYTIQITNP